MRFLSFADCGAESEDSMDPAVAGPQIETYACMLP
jgi:hypothetical protein